MFDWLEDIIDALSDAISDAFSSVATDIIDRVLTRYLQWLFERVYDGLADFFSSIAGMANDLFALDWVRAFIKLFSVFGWSLFVVGLVVSAFDLAVEYQNGRASIKSTALNWIKGFLAVNLFTKVPIELYRFCVTIQNTFAHDLSELFASQQTFSLSDVAAAAIVNAFTNNGVLMDASLFLLACIIALGYCVVKVFFDNLKRGGILLIQIAVGSLYMFSIPRGYSESFTQWIKQVIALCLTTFLQTTILFMGLLTFNNSMLLGLGLMMSAAEVPRIAERFGLDTSVKFNAMSAMHMTSTAVHLAKTVAA